MRDSRQAGTVSLFATIVMLPLVIVVMAIGQFGDRAVTRAVREHRLRSCVMSAAASFDCEMLNDYGIYAVTEKQAWQGVEGDDVVMRLSGSLEEEEVFARAVLAEGENQAGVVAMDRAIGKIKLIASYSEEAQETLEVVAEQAGEVASESISAIIGQNLPDIDIGEMLQGVLSMGKALGDNWTTVDWSWLWENEEKSQLNVGGIVAEAKAFFCLVQGRSLSQETRERVAYSAYAMRYLSAYDKSVSRTTLFATSEVEYCIFGKMNGAVNIVESFVSIYKMRVAINLVDYLVTLEIPEPTTLLVCASVLAVIAATTEVVTLMGDNTVKMSPHLGMVDVDYRDHLAIMLLMESAQTLLQRIGNVISMNLEQQGGRSMGDYFTVIAGCCDQEEYSYAYR